jgi:hypothetical protein
MVASMIKLVSLSPSDQIVEIIMCDYISNDS